MNSSHYVLNDKFKNQKFELYEESGRYYLKVNFEYEDQNGVYKGQIDKLNFDFSLNRIDVKTCGKSCEVTAEFHAPSMDGYGCYLTDVVLDSKNEFFTFETIKEKIYEMTVEEIEEKLGRKIKIISKSK